MRYDGSIYTGIKLAISLHNFIANNHVSAYIYWLAMLDQYSNEALIIENYSYLYYPKVYYVFGQFTKWIRPGNFFFFINKTKLKLKFNKNFL